MISLLIEFIMVVLDFFCLNNNDIQSSVQKIDTDFLSLSLLLKKDLQEEINNEIEKNDFLNDFNEKWNK